MTASQAPLRLADRYLLDGLLGTGSTAEVYRGVDQVLGRPVAVKIFRPDVEFHDAARVEAEGRTLAALNHPGLVAVYDAGTAQLAHGESRYLVMELVEGPSLATAVQEGPLTPAVAALLGAQLADALAHVHAQGVMHRDIKPANILMEPAGHAKITDFGIARIIDSARRTATGMTIGTAAYLSPEQVTGAAVGPPTDIYSLGLVLLEALTGHREYPGNGAEAAVARLHRPPVIPVSLPAPWPTLLASMTQPDPATRPTAAEVAATLLGATGSPAVQQRAVPASPLAPTVQLPAAETVPLPTRTPKRGKRRVAVAAVVISAAAAISAGVLLQQYGGGGASPTVSSTPGSTFDQDVRDLQRAVTP